MSERMCGFLISPRKTENHKADFTKGRKAHKEKYIHRAENWRKIVYPSALGNPLGYLCSEYHSS